MAPDPIDHARNPHHSHAELLACLAIPMDVATSMGLLDAGPCRCDHPMMRLRDRLELDGASRCVLVHGFVCLRCDVVIEAIGGVLAGSYPYRASLPRAGKGGGP